MALTSEMESMIANLLDEAAQDYEKEIRILKQDNQEMRERLNLLSDGSQISRSEFQQMEQRLRNEMDETQKLRRTNAELESRLNSAISKLQSLENQVQRQNTDMTNGVQDIKIKETAIDNLQKEVQKLDSTIKKQRVDIERMNEEKKKMANAQKELENTNQMLQSTVQQLFERDQSMIQTLQESAEQIAMKDEEIANLQMRFEKRENRQKRNNEGGNDPKQTTIIKEDSSTLNDIQSQLVTFKKANRELKNQVSLLQEEERRANRLQQALETRNKQMEELQKQLNEKDTEIQSYNHTAEDFILQIEMYRQRLKMSTDTSEEQTKALREEMEHYRSRYDTDIKRINNLESLIEEKSNEIVYLRKKVAEFESGEFGLPQAVNEMKEMRAMIDVREKHISELVTQLNSMDKIICGLANQLGGEFDTDKFLKEMNQKIEDDEQKRVAIATRELEAKIKMMKEYVPIGNIKIVVENEQASNTKVVATFAQNEMTKGKTQVTTEKKGQNQKNNESLKKSQKDMKKTTAPEIPTVSFESPVPHYQKDTSNVMMFDANVQCNLMPIEISQKMATDETDEWVTKLQRDHLSLKRTHMELSDEYEALKQKLGKIGRENEGLQMQISNFIAENEDLKSRLSNSEKPIPLTKTKIIEVQNKSLLSLLPKGTCTRTKPSEIVSMNPIKKIFTLISKNVALVPSPEEFRRISNKGEEIKNDLQNAKKRIIEMEREESILREKLRQSESIKIQYQATNEELKNDAQEQRIAFKEKLRQIQEESNRLFEARVKEAIETHNLLKGNTDPDGDMSQIPEVSKYIQKLKAEISGLRSKNIELDSIIAMNTKQVSEYQIKLKQLEEDKESKENSPENDRDPNGFHEHYQKMQRQNQDLKKRVTWYKEQMEQMKLSKPIRDINTEELSETGNTEDIIKMSSRIKGLEAKIVQYKATIEELQIRLTRSNSTVERLTKLVQKRESSLALLQDKANQSKHRIEKQEFPKPK